MITEDDEFARIEREIAMKRGQPYHWEVEAIKSAVRMAQRPWVSLTDEELLQVYGWRLTSGVSNFILEEAKQELLGALRKVEAKIKEKNT